MLLDWVQATASYGFMEAYSAFVRAFSDEERNRYYAESERVALLFGATGAPLSLASRSLRPSPVASKAIVRSRPASACA